LVVRYASAVTAAGLGETLESVIQVADHVLRPK
jgi:hypothetical protein